MRIFYCYAMSLISFGYLGECVCVCVLHRLLCWNAADAPPCSRATNNLGHTIFVFSINALYVCVCVFLYF